MLWLKKLLKIATPDEIELNNIRQETERLKSEIEDMQNIKSSMQSEISAIEYELKEKQAPRGAPLGACLFFAYFCALP